MVVETLGIGEFGKATGLPVSALRHYDAEGVLVPAAVDPATRYRSYSPSQVAAGRIVASLRALEVPLAVMAEVVGALPDRTRAHAALDAHWHSVEARVRTARSLVERAHRLIDHAEEKTMTSRATMDGPRLAEAIRRVAPIALPSVKPGDNAALTGVLLESGPARLRLVATDRVRLVWHDVAVSVANKSRIDVVAAAGFLLDVADAVEGVAKVVVEVSDGRIEVRGGGARGVVLAEDDALAAAFPPYQAFIPSGGGLRAVFDSAALAEALSGRSEARYVKLSSSTGALSLRGLEGSDWAADVDADVQGEGIDIGLDGDLVHDSIESLPGGQLLLSVDGPLLPILLRPVDRPDCAAVIMPVQFGRKDGKPSKKKAEPA